MPFFLSCLISRGRIDTGERGEFKPDTLLLVHDGHTDTFVIDRFSGIRKSVVRVSSGRYGEIIKTDDLKLCCVTQNYVVEN